MTLLAIVDTGPLLAAVNRADPDHRACVEALQSAEHDLLIPALCVAEATYLLGRRQGPSVEARFLEGLEIFDIQAPRPDDWPRIAALVEQYSDLPLGGTDASVIVLAERHRADVIVTLDRRHFGVVRPRHGEVGLLP